MIPLRTMFATLLVAAAAAAHGQCRAITTWQQCPLWGCAQEGTNEAAANIVRKAIGLTAPERTPQLEVENFVTLQLSTDETRHHPQGFAIRDRTEFQGARFDAGKRLLGETMIVSLRGYIVGHPHATHHESETCNLVAPGDNNWWINIAESPTDTDYESVLTVVPPSRDKRWALAKLRWIEQQHWMVRATGQLFYDSRHRVNSDAATDLIAEPHRLSLWEIHPVIVFQVCESTRGDVCRRAGAHWVDLESIELPWNDAN